MGRPNYGDLHQQLLEQYAPPSIIVNEEYDILHLTERAGRYLHIGGGEPSKNLLKLIRPELRLELRTAFYQATQQQTNVEARNLKVRLDDKTQTLTIHVRPVINESHPFRGNPAQGFMLVLFEPTDESNSPANSVLTSEEPVARHLEQELIRVKAQLRASNEQHETQAEELKASNEELQAMNEELRSAAEELETSKEELQSINEELTTVNQELKVKVEEISLTSNNFQNLINSTDLATLFLDRSLRVNLFTPAARTIFNLIPADFGRPLSDITNRLEYARLAEDAQAVLQTLQPLEREVHAIDGRMFMMRILPYRTAEDRINGIVLTFVDISGRKAAEAAVRQSEERMRLVFESARDYAIFTLNEQRMVTSWSTGAQLMTGYSEADIIGQPADMIFTPEDRQRGAPEREAQITRQEGRAQNERWHMRKDGTRFWGSGSVSPLRDEAGSLLGYVKIMRDLTEQRAAEENKSFLAAIVESSQDSVLTTNFEGIITSWNQAAENLYGYPASEAIGKPLTILTLPSDLAQVLSQSDQIKDSRRVELFDTVRINKDGREMHLEIVMSPVQDATGRPVGISTIARDITLRHQSEQDQALRIKTLEQTESLALTGSWEYDRATNLFNWSAGMYNLFALEAGIPVQPVIYQEVALEADQALARQLVDQIEQGTESLEQVIRIRAGEKVKTLKIKSVVLTDEHGEPRRVLGIDWDITEQMLAQEQIRQSAENLQAVLDASPACIGLLKVVHGGDDTAPVLDFKLAVGNQKLTEFFGEPLDQLLGQSAQYFCTLLWEDQTMDLLREVYETRQPRYGEKYLGSPEADRWLGVAVSRQDDGVVLTGLDITELKQAQTQQQRWINELEQASQSTQALTQLRDALQQRGELLRSASHDLRGQVGVIASAAQLLSMADTETDRSLMIQMIHRNIEQMTQMMSNLLDFARLEASQEVAQASRFDLAGLLRELAEGMQPLAAERGLWLIAEGPVEHAVESDPVQVRRIAQNLLLNALKYTQTGGVTISWLPLENGVGWQLRVSDTGPGLSAQQLARLRGEVGLSPSGPGGDSITKPGSEGIGLSIVQRLCGLLGATLAVESQPGEGTRFTISFDKSIA